MPKFEDLTGQRFGYLTVIKKAGKNKSDKILWLCKCDCGKLKIIQGASLKNGRTKSCGCLRKKGARRTHGFKYTRLYCIWQVIKKRFLNFRVNIVYKTIKNEGNIEDAVDELIGYICKVMGVNKICLKKKK